MNIHRTHLPLAALLVIGTVLAACSQPATAPVTGVAPAATAADTAVAPQLTTAPKVTAEGGGEAGVESALTTYADAAQGFAISHPGNWTQDTSVAQGVKFAGGDSYMILEIVKPPSATDTMSFAQNDVAAVRSAFAGFKQLSLAPSTEVQNAIILGYEAMGTSTVTGKTFSAHDERYYMPLADGRIAILTVAGPAANYDREGVRDIALTFKSTK